MEMLYESVTPGLNIANTCGGKVMANHNAQALSQQGNPPPQWFWDGQAKMHKWSSRDISALAQKAKRQLADAMGLADAMIDTDAKNASKNAKNRDALVDLYTTLNEAATTLKYILERLGMTRADHKQDKANRLKANVHTEQFGFERQAAADILADRERFLKLANRLVAVIDKPDNRKKVLLRNIHDWIVKRNLDTRTTDAMLSCFEFLNTCLTCRDADKTIICKELRRLGDVGAMKQARQLVPDIDQLLGKS